MPGHKTSIRSQRFGSLGFNKSSNKAPPLENKQVLTDDHEPAVPQQENINANTLPKLPEPMRNLMYDPRVVRGSHFPPKPKILLTPPTPHSIHLPPEETWSAPRKPVISSRTTKKPNTVSYSDEPAPIKGRKHCDIQGHRQYSSICGIFTP